MQRPGKETIMETVLAAKAPSARTPTARCPSPKVGKGRGGWGLTEPNTTVISSRERDKQLSFQAEGEKSYISNPPVLRRRSGAAETAGFTVLEQVSKVSLPCSPPIPSFRPRR